MSRPYHDHGLPCEQLAFILIELFTVIQCHSESKFIYQTILIKKITDLQCPATLIQFIYHYSQQSKTETAMVDFSSEITDGKMVVGQGPVDLLADMANDDPVQNPGILEVSDGEPLDGDTSDMDDLDALIDGQNQSINMSKVGNPPADSLDTFLTSEYCEEEKCPSLPPVSDTLAGIVTSWLRTTPKKEKVKELFKSALLPENVEGLLPVQINELLYQCLPSRFHFADQRLHGQNTFFTRGLGPLISLLNKILKIQVALRNC